MSDYKVGKNKPPLNTRFQKGQSGNPDGRPPKKEQQLILTERIRQLLQKPRWMLKDGKRVKLSYLDAGLEKLGIKFAQGDKHAWQVLIALEKLLPTIIEQPGEVILIEFQGVPGYDRPEAYDAAMQAKKLQQEKVDAVFNAKRDEKKYPVE